MEFFFAVFKKINLGRIKTLLSDANWIVGAVVFLVIVFLALVSIDAYLFYGVRTREAQVAPLSVPLPVLSAYEIDETVKLMDRREQEYQALVNPQ